MLEKLMKAYIMAMAYDVRSPMLHLVGPPGCGKSTFVEQLADLLDVELHIVNVSRLSPLELEGVMMPHGSGDEMILKMLPSTFWTGLKDGDILFLDEFLRGFPEVFNGFLDIFTSRRVGSYRLPKVFIIGASNSVVAYDHALEDRLLHMTVPDPRRSKAERQRIATILVETLGLSPSMIVCSEMTTLLDSDVLPTYSLLDTFKKKGSKVTTAHVAEGVSVRNLIGQAQLRLVTSPNLKDLIEVNNHTAMAEGKYQYVLLLSAGKAMHPAYKKQALKLKGNPKLTEIQARNLELNLQLIEMEEARMTQEEED